MSKNSRIQSILYSSHNRKSKATIIKNIGGRWLQ